MRENRLRGAALLLSCLVAGTLCSAAVAPTAGEAAGIDAYSLSEAYEPMRRWLVLGPIPALDDGLEPAAELLRQAFDRDQLSERGGEARIRPAPGHLGSASLAWAAVTSEQDVVDLSAVLGGRENVIAYAWAELDAPEPERVLLGIGSDDAVKVWLNGELIHDNWTGRPVRRDDDIVEAGLREGRNGLLIKVQNGPREWGFTCRVLGADALGEQLRVAAGRGDLDEIDRLLDHGADPDRKSPHGVTALHVARVMGREEATRALVARGADDSIPIPPAEAMVDELFEEIVVGLSPGAAVLVARDGKILLEKGYGYASLEHRVPITPETKFRIGSITKQFTASAILKLQEQGKLSVSDTLSKHVPGYPRGDEVTLHHLLTHTSGIHSYTEKPGFYETVTVETKPEAMIETFESDPFDFDPGEGWHYSNSGYFLLGHIVEKVSSQTYADFLQKQLFEPLGMRDTGVHHWSTVLDHEATGYSVEGDEVKRALDWDMSRAGGAGALYSTVGDLFRWNEAVFGGTALAEESIAAALTPVTVEMEERPEDALLGMLGGGYGYGWIISESRGRRTVEHGGGLQGWVAHLVRYPELNTTVVVLANAVPPPAGLNPSLQSRAIAEIYLWPELAARESVAVARGIDPSVYDAYAGRYEFMGLICTIAREGDRLFSTLTGQPKLELHPRSETEFFLKEADVTFTFEREDGGQTDEVVIVDRGRRFVARRIPERVVAKIDPVLLEAYAGEYDYRMGRVLTVTAEDGKLFAQMTGQPRFEIFPESEAEFFWKIVNAKITFVKNEQGIVVKAIHEQGGAKLEASKIK